MEEDVLNALQMRCAYLSGGYDREKRIIFIVNAFNDQQLWNRRCLQLTLDYLKRSLSAAILQNGVSVIVNAQESSSRISRQHVRQIYALFGGDISVDLYLVRAEGFWEKHVEPCAKSQIKGEPLVLSKTRLAKFIEPQNLPEELGGTLQFNYDLWLQQRKAIDEFSRTHALTLGTMEQLLTLLAGHRSLRPAEADVELKKCAQLHTHVQRSIEAAIEMGNAILARFNEVYETPTQAATHATPAATTTTATTTSAATTMGLSRPLLPPDLGCERARIELRLNEIEKKQTAIRTAWLELLRSLREARELCTLEEGVAFVTNWILNQAEQLLSRQRSIGGDVRGAETLRSAHDQLELECRETYGCYAELLYKIEQFSSERSQLKCQDLLSQRDFMQFVCRSFAERLEKRRKVLMTSLRFHRLYDQFEAELLIANQAADAEPSELNSQQAKELLMQLKTSQKLLVNIERELVREGEKLSDMLSMPVKDALGRDLQLDYSNDIAQLRRRLDASRARRQRCGERVALQRLTLEQVTHIHGYEQEVHCALNWMNELYAVLLRCHSHVGCNIHEIQLQKDELQGFEETGRSIYNYGCQLLEASQTLRLCCKLERSEPEQFLLQLQRTWHSLQSISQEQMTRLRVSAVFHRSVEAYYRQLRDLRPLLTHELATQLQQQRQQHNRSSSGISSDADADVDADLFPAGGLGARLQRHLLAREQLLVEVGRMVRLGRLLKKRLKEPFLLDALTGKSEKMFARFRNIFAKSKTDEVPIIVVNEPMEEAENSEDIQTENQTEIKAPLASEEEESESLNETLSKSSQELSQLLDAINLSSKLPDNDESNEDDDDDDDDDNDDTASTSSVKTKIAKASIERDIPTDIEEEEEEAIEQHSLDKIKALIRNDSETYPQSDYTDTEDNATPSHSRTASQDSTADKLTLLPCDYSIIPEELPFDSPVHPSPLHDSGRNSSADSETCPTVQLSPSTVTVTPTGSNELACAAISHKLSAIAEVAESLDAVIRDCSGAIDVDLSKKLGSHAVGSEDWQSRSTEDESFATASEGNFTPNSHSSSFQTASYIGSAKNSFDEADDSTLSNFEIPELPQSPVNMSFDSSELSYFSAQQPPLHPCEADDDQDSVVGVAELHSQSVTPTPEMELELEVQHPIESDSEIEAYGLDSNVISTEFMPSVSTAVTPEVSSADCAAAADCAASASTNNNNNNEQKTNWRRSKYYENITKQTIKGFL
ncbi:SEC14 domain and spectrin repeat-containing protein 1 isoform X1 [Drosophila innubila]|uniref:SEC14 domain and spectrin repeat-containing protein 1 isoform X1 n=1 Tax=Drosophila innubila TaxID=198719 RepID=UPI00148B6DA1|nr:SEC14 domain and spectrin repeat-containing protein 1 isoform X1 [Drosophila innubila]